MAPQWRGAQMVLCGTMWALAMSIMVVGMAAARQPDIVLSVLHLGLFFAWLVCAGMLAYHCLRPTTPDFSISSIYNPLLRYLLYILMTLCFLSVMFGLDADSFHIYIPIGSNLGIFLGAGLDEYWKHSGHAITTLPAQCLQSMNERIHRLAIGLRDGLVFLVPDMRTEQDRDLEEARQALLDNVETSETDLVRMQDSTRRPSVHSAAEGDTISPM